MNDQIFFFFHNLAHQSQFFDGFVVFFAEVFPEILIAAVIIVYLSIFWDGTQDLDLQLFLRKHQDLFKIAFSGIIAWVFSKIIKILIHAERPFTLLSDVYPLFDETGFAFPSSHASIFAAAAMTTFFINKKIGYVFLTLALLIGIARVIAGVHFPIDILGGFALGALIAYFFKKL